MRDVELLVRFEGFRFFLSDYAGNLRAFLDDTCEKLNSQWDDRADEISSSIDEFEESISAMLTIFGEEDGSQMDRLRIERRPNRAVLDAMVFYLSHPRIRNAAKKKKQAVLNGFKKLCENNSNFRKSLETTTKSLSATYDRL